MAEVDPIDPFKPHREDEHPDEHGAGGNGDTDPYSHDRETEEQGEVKRLIMEKITREGFRAPPDVYYDAFTRGAKRILAVSEDKVSWYQMEFGFISGENSISLIPIQGESPAPDGLKQKFEMELPHEEETTQGATEYLKKVFDNPKLDGVSYGVYADDRVWVSLSRTNAVKYFIREDGTAEDVGGKRVRLPDTLKSRLGKTSVEAMTEREAKIKSNREKEKYLKSLQEMGEVNIELRERNEEIEAKRIDLNEEMREKDAKIASMQAKLDENRSHFEQLGQDMLELKNKEEHDRRLIKDLQESLEGTVTAAEKAKLTAEMQTLVRENANNIETINEKEGQLRQFARDINQQKERIGELERQKEELEATITYQQREIERNNAQIDQNEREIGDRDLDDAERERQELERENEQLEE